MSPSRLLISRKLIQKYPELKFLKGVVLRDCLSRLLRDPDLWRKVSSLRSGKFKKQYQSYGLDLKKLDFYPFPEDWALLSILSNGTGFSRCYIFIHLLRYDIGDLSLEDTIEDTIGTPKISAKHIESKRIFATIYVDLRELLFQRKLRTQPKDPNTPRNPVIELKAEEKNLVYRKTR